MSTINWQEEGFDRASAELASGISEIIIHQNGLNGDELTLIGSDGTRHLIILVPSTVFSIKLKPVKLKGM